MTWRAYRGKGFAWAMGLTVAAWALPATAAAPQAAGQPPKDAKSAGGAQAGANAGAKEALDEVGIQDSSAEWESITSERETDLSDVVNVEDIIETGDEYHYASFGAPDPFMPADVSQLIAPTTEQAETINGVEIPMLSSLQKFPLENLKVIGIWQLESGERRAMIMTPDQEGIIIKLNDPIAAGKVIDIQADRVLTRQYSIRNDGVREAKEIPMYIGRPPEDAIKGKIILTPGSNPQFQAKPTPVEGGIGGSGYTPGGGYAMPRGSSMNAPGGAGGNALVPELPASIFPTERNNRESTIRSGSFSPNANEPVARPSAPVPPLPERLRNPEAPTR